MADLETPSDWGAWILDNIHNPKNHPKLEAALVEYIPSEYQASVRSAFLEYANATSVTIASPYDAFDRISDSIDEAERQEKQLMNWIREQKPELTTNMYYSSKRSLHALTAAMEQLCWIAERLEGDYDLVGLEYHEMTRLCVSDATCALDLCGHWIDILVDKVSLETSEIARRLNDLSRSIHSETRKQKAEMRAKKEERDRVSRSVSNLRKSLEQLNGKRGDCLGDSKALTDAIREAEKQINDQQERMDRVSRAIIDCEEILGGLQFCTGLISGLRDGMDEVGSVDNELRKTLADFKTKLSAYKTHISMLRNADEAMGNMTNWKEEAAKALLNATKESLFCYPTVPYARRIVETILAGYKEVPKSVQDAADRVSTAIDDLHEPFPLPLPKPNL